MDKMIGDRIKSLRNTCGLTKAQVSDSIRISRQKYARIENGTYSVTLDILTKLAELFNVTVGDITSVLDEAPVKLSVVGDEHKSLDRIFDMLELFYANKRLYNRLRQET